MKERRVCDSDLVSENNTPGPLQTALIRSDMVCPASKEISALDVITEDFTRRRNGAVPALIGILVGAFAVALAVGVLLALTVRYRQGTPTHLLSDKLQRLVLSDRRSSGKGVSLLKASASVCLLQAF